jgi:hypothetical protein
VPNEAAEKLAPILLPCAAAIKEKTVARYKSVDTSPRLLPVDLEALVHNIEKWTKLRKVA